MLDARMETPAMSDQPRIAIDYYSDLLCVWAYIAQARVDELRANLGDQVAVHHRYFSLFGDTAFKIGRGWADRGGYAGFNRHLHDVGQGFGHIELHPDLWTAVRPVSSTGAHLTVKAAQRVGPEEVAENYAWALRLAFFRDGRDIAVWDTLAEVARDTGLDPDALDAEIRSGRAHAALAADDRDRERYRIEGSPTFVLNEGRQKLSGNVGYRVLEANLRELMREPAAGAASWC
jgi:predicted DsbA family dithiol-disulfide isomerase